jgi:hypothetical protein
MPDFVAPDQLDAAVEAGLAPVAGEVNVTTADGRVVKINAADYGALRNEFEGVATDDQTYAYQQQQAAQARQVALSQQGDRAFWEAAGATAWDQTLGLVGPVKGRDLMERIAGMGAAPTGEASMYAADDPRRWYAEQEAGRYAGAAYSAESRAVADANKDAAGWGRFTGTVGGGLAASAITGGFGGLGAAGTLGKLGVAGLEGGIAGLTTAREEAFIKNEQLSSSAAWDAVQHGALFGVAIGGAFAGLGAGYNALRGAGKGVQAAAEGLEAGAMGATRAGAGTAAREGAETVAGALERRTGSVGDGMIKRLAGEEAEALVGQGKQLATRGLENTERNAREVTGALTDVFGQGNATELLQTMKPEIVKRLTNPAMVQTQRSSVANLAADQGTTVQSLLERAKDFGLNKDSRGALTEAADLIHTLRFGAEKMSGEEIFLAQDSIKRSLQKAAQQLGDQGAFKASQGMGTTAKALRDAASELNVSQARMIENLTNEEVWGKGLAQFQRYANEGWEEFFASHGMLKSSLLREGERVFATGHRELLGSSAKTAAHLAQAGTAAADDVSNAVTQGVLAQRKIIEALEKYGGVTGNKNLEAVKKAVDTLDRVHTTTLKHADAKRALANLESAHAESATTQGLGLIPGIGKALQAVTNPANAVRALAMVERHTGSTESTLGSIARQALGGAQAAATGAGARGAMTSIAGLARGASAQASRNAMANMTGVSERMRPYAKTAAVTGGVSAGFYRGADSPQQAYQSRVREVNATAAPGAAEAHAAQLLGPMGKDAPKFAAAFTQQMRTAADFLASKAPVPPDRPGELQGNRKLPLVDQRAVEKFGRYYTAVNQPMECAALLAKGQLRPEHVEALKVVHPQILQTLQNSVLQQVESMKDPIPPGRARQLDILLDLGGRADPTIKQENLRIMADVGAQRAAQAQQAPQGRGAPNLAGASATRSSELANR